MPVAASPPDFITTQSVANHLGVPLATLTWWIWALRENRRYDEFEIRRRNGGAPRQIAAPIKPIKDLQRRLADTLTASYEPRLHVHGFVPSRSPITNARFHRRKRWVLRVDLQNFFPSINFGRVRGLFMAYPFDYPPDVATILAQLCCHRGHLPQGAPTSPIISNFICKSMDKQIARLAASHHCHYTRYADDLTFSTGRASFPKALAYIDNNVTAVGASLESAIEQNGFRVNETKTRLMVRSQRQRVTGLVVNEEVNLPREYIRSVRNLLHVWQVHGEQDAAAALERHEPRANWPPGKSPPEFRLVVRGRVQHIGAVRGYDDFVYTRLADTLSKVDAEFRRSVVIESVPGVVRLFTEGPTDTLHVTAAIAYFAARGEFGDLALVVNPGYTPTNDGQLFKHLEALALTQQAQPCVGLFDRDVKIGRETIPATGWLNLGNGVVAVALATPPWRQDNEAICIEMLYPMDALSREGETGLRLFLREEFAAHGVHESGRYVSPRPKHETLVREEVFRNTPDDDRSVGLSKMAFAKAVSTKAAPYEDIDQEGFRQTFALLERAVREAWADVQGSGGR
jgi:RNA-directed DNA polymerase